MNDNKTNTNGDEMKAQINKVNEGCIVVSLYNAKRIINQRYFTTMRKAENFCKKYGYEIEQMNDGIDNSLIYTI